MTDKVVLKITASVTYEANPADYGTDSVAEMIKIDSENFKNGMAMLEDFGDPTEDFSITEIK